MNLYLLQKHLRSSRLVERDSSQMETSALAVAEPHQSTAERYESLIRIANSIREGKEPRELFSILAHELSRVIQFDGIDAVAGSC